MKTQIEFLKEIVLLSEQNPDMDVYFFSEPVDSNDVLYVCHQISSVAIRRFSKIGNTMLTNDYNDYDVLNYLYDENDHIEIENIEGFLESKLQNIPKAIIVYIHATVPKTTEKECLKSKCLNGDRKND